MKKLTLREQRFVDAYTSAAEGNGAKAAEMAGYAKGGAARVTATRLLKREQVKAAIVNRQQQIANAVLQAEQVVERGKIADATERRVVLSAMFLDAQAHPLARLKAVEILNKMDGLYVQKVDVTHHTKPDLSKLSDAELAALEQLVTKAAPAVQSEAVH